MLLVLLCNTILGTEVHKNHTLVLICAMVPMGPTPIKNSESLRQHTAGLHTQCLRRDTDELTRNFPCRKDTMEETVWRRVQTGMGGESIPRQNPKGKENTYSYGQTGGDFSPQRAFHLARAQGTQGTCCQCCL